MGRHNVAYDTSSGKGLPRVYSDLTSKRVKVIFNGPVGPVMKGTLLGNVMTRVGSVVTWPHY